MDKEQLAIARLQDAARLSEHRYKKAAHGHILWRQGFAGAYGAG